MVVCTVCNEERVREFLRKPRDERATIRRHDDGTQKREGAVRRRGQDPDNPAAELGGEASLRREVEQPPEVCGGVPPGLEVRQGDGRGDVSLLESPDARAFHSFTRCSSSSISSHSWNPYVTYRFPLRRCLYMHGPYSSSSCPYHLSQSLQRWWDGSWSWSVCADANLAASGRTARAGRPVHAVAPTNPTRPAAMTRMPGRPMPATTMIAPMTAQKIAAAFIRARGNRRAWERR